MTDSIVVEVMQPPDIVVEVAAAPAIEVSVAEVAIEVSVSGSMGPKGKRGSLWWVGTGPPGTISGALSGDLYLDESNGDVYALGDGAVLIGGYGEIPYGTEPYPASTFSDGGLPNPGDLVWGDQMNSYIYAVEERTTGAEGDLAALEERVVLLEQGAVGEVPSVLNFTKQPSVRTTTADGWVIAYELDVTHPQIRHQISIGGADFTNIAPTDEGWGAYSFTLSGYSIPTMIEVVINVSTVNNLAGTNSEVLLCALVDFPPGLYDVFLVMGQSNAQGSAETNNDADEVIIATGKAYEFTHATAGANPALVHLADPVGNAMNGSMWPSFAKKWHDLTGRYAVMVPRAIGGTSVTKRLPADASGYLTAAEASLGYCMTYMQAQGDKPMGKVYAIWWQGEADQAGSMTTATYQGHLETIAAHLDANTVAEQMLVVRSHYRVTGSLVMNQNIMIAQDNVTSTGPQAGFSTLVTKETTFTRDTGGLWDNSVHCFQWEYNRLGVDVANRTYQFAALGQKPSIPEEALYAVSAPANAGNSTTDVNVLLDFRTGQWHNIITPGVVFTSAYFDPYILDQHLYCFGGVRLDPDMMMVLNAATPWTIQYSGMRLSNDPFGMLGTSFRDSKNIMLWFTTAGAFTVRGNNTTQTWTGAVTNWLNLQCEVVLQSDPATGLITLWVNGVSKGTKPLVGDMTIDNLFGSYNNTSGINGSNQYMGFCDYLAIETRLVPPEEWISNTALRMRADPGVWAKNVQAGRLGASLPD